MSDTLLRVEDLKIYYPVAGSGFGKKEFVKAVDGVTFEVKKGEVFGIVGESGCGKSTLGRGVCKLENLTSGHVYLDGEDITEYNDRRMRSIRKKVQMVFQDPYGSLNPSKTIGWIMEEPLRLRGPQGGGLLKPEERRERVIAMLHRVGLDEKLIDRYPNQLSGGQRQRICIGTALMQEPKLLIADEPVSALDVTIQAQVLELLKQLKEEMGLSILFISHDLRVVYQMCNHVMIMQKGQFVEMGVPEEIYFAPKDPYTKKLLESAGIE